MVPEILAIAAALMFAIAILPGTLGVLLMTSKIAAREWGARLIYEKAIWLGGLAAVVMAAAWAMAAAAQQFSLVLMGASAVFGGIGVFGFFMHTRLMFKPVKNPLYMSVDEAMSKFGPDEEVVGVIDESGRPWAYIARLARRPHIVEQRTGDHPFMMTHCILAHSSMAFALEDRFAEPDITITSALANNLVFYERKSKCSIVQAHNGSIGRDISLRMKPTIAVSLKTWRSLYPDSPVWYRKREWRDDFYLNLLARADVIDPNSPVMVYPLKHLLDERLPMKAMVTGVEINGKSRTYSLQESQKNPLIHDRFENTDLLIASAYDNDLIQVFDRKVGDIVLTFTADGANRFVDQQTKSLWDMRGICIEGQMKGASLRLAPHYSKMFWYVWADYHPGTEVYRSDRQAAAA